MILNVCWPSSASTFPSSRMANGRRSGRSSAPRVSRARTSDKDLAIMAGNQSRWAKTMVVEEYGLAPTPKSPTLAALSTFAAFILCGLVPLVTYLGAGGLLPCVAATGLVFFAIGAIKSRWSLTAWWRSGLGTFIIGMFAAALAFWVGFGLRMLFNLSAG